MDIRLWHNDQHGVATAGHLSTDRRRKNNASLGGIVCRIVAMDEEAIPSGGIMTHWRQCHDNRAFLEMMLGSSNMPLTAWNWPLIGNGLHRGIISSSRCVESSS